jgi:hypothetical protein
MPGTYQSATRQVETKESGKYHSKLVIIVRIIRFIKNIRAFELAQRHALPGCLNSTAQG